MHPLLARPARLLLVVATAALFGLPLAWLLRLIELRPWSSAIAFGVPLMVFYSFVVLSAWWVCRRNPMSGVAAWKVFLAQLSVAVQASAVWVAMAAIWSVFLDRWLYDGLIPTPELKDRLALKELPEEDRGR